MSGGYSPTPGTQLRPENIPHDLALLHLAQPITSTEADPFLVHSGPLAGRDVSPVSCGRRRNEALTREGSCALTGQSIDGIMGFDCDATFGSSGAPVFVRHGTRFRIASVIPGVGTENGMPFAYGMTLPQAVAGLQQQLRNEQARPVASTGARRLTVGQRSSGARFIKPGG